MKRKRRRRRFSDRQATTYAIDRDLVVVTNNASDFEKIYGGRLLHPGLVVLLAVGQSQKIDREDQILMMDAALRSIEASEPVQEIIRVEIVRTEADQITVTISRTELPPHSD